MTGSTHPVTSDPAASGHPGDMPIPPRYWWLKRLTLAGGCLVVGLVLLRLAWGWEVNRRLAAEIARYRAAGQPVYSHDFDKAVRAVPDADNAAILYGQAIKALTPGQDVRVTQDQFSLRPALFYEAADSAAQFVEANRQALDLLHQARTRSAVAWANQLSTHRTPGASARGLLRLLWFAASQQRTSGDCAACVRTSHDGIALAAAIEAKPDILAAASGWAGYSLMFSLIEDMGIDLRIARDADAPTSGTAIRPADRAEVEQLLATLLDERASRAASVNAMYGERGVILDTANDIATTGIPGWDGPPLWDRVVATAGGRSVLLTDVTRQLQIITAGADALAADDWTEAQERLGPADSAPPGGTSVVRPFTCGQLGMSRSEIRRLVEIDFQMLARRRMAAAALAILLFETDHGRPPATLGELVPDYVATLPVDPFSPAHDAIRYRPDAPRPALYSVGADGKDDGGPHDGQPLYPAVDIVFYLQGSDRWVQDRKRERQ